MEGMLSRMIRDSTPPSDSAKVNNCNFPESYGILLCSRTKSNETIPPKPLICFWQFHEKDEILTLRNRLF
jgi:hypothetical protein